jgi:TolB protein
MVSSDRGDVTRHDLADGRATRLTTDPADELDADLSPDGRLVAYRRASGVGDEADIWVMNRDGSKQHDLTDDPSLNNWAPAWSPDGTRLCFNSTRDAGINRVWTMAADGSDLQPVTDGWGEYCDWSPDGTSITYASAGTSGYDLWIRRLDGSSPVPLARLPGSEFFPAWSPDGAWIAFEHVDEGVWLVHPDGSDARFLGEGGGIVWSPDGRLGLDRPGGFGLYDPAADTFQRTGLDIGAFPSWSR